MKQNNFKRAISLLLVLTMMISLATTTFASEESEIMPYQSEVALPGNGGDGDLQLFGGDFGGWGINTLASGTISGLVGIGLNQTYGAIFGTDSDRIMNAIAELSKQIDRIDAKIDQLISETQKGNINDFLNKYRSDIAPYKALLRDFEIARDKFGDDSVKSTSFALSVYYGTNPSMKRYGDNIVAVVRELKSMLVDDVEIINGHECNVFGAFDLLERYNNSWEHQGYDIRSNFRNTALGLFVEFSVIAKKAVADAIDDCNKRNDLDGLIAAELAAACLEDYLSAVGDMEMRCRVIQHPDLRIFRNTNEGRDLYAFYQRVDPAYVEYPSDEEIYSVQDNSYTIISDSYKYCMTTTDHIISETYRNGGLEVISAQAWRGNLQEIFVLYNQNKSPEQIKTLYDILFDPKEGNFINAGNLKKGTRFATDYYIFKKNVTMYYSQLRWDTNVVEDGGTLIETVKLLRINSDKSTKETYVEYISPEKFFSVILYRGAINQGALNSSPSERESSTADMITGMEYSYTLPYADPVTLTVKEVEGATYQWFVHRGDDDKGFEAIEGETAATCILPALDSSMNGWMYQCAIIEEEVSEWGEGYTVSDPVTLNLIGEGIPAPTTVHEVSSAQELEEALSKVTDRSWHDHTLKLTSEIKYEKPITLNNSSMTIDLNGYNMEVMPDKTAEPNINFMSNNEEIAAVNVQFGSLQLIGEGELNVFAPEGVAYGVYAGELADITVHNAISNNGGTAVYAADGGVVNIRGDAEADGKDAYAVRCFNGGDINVSGNVIATGELACGVYADESNAFDTAVNVNGDIIVSGDNSKGVWVNGEKVLLEVGGSVTVSGDNSSGLSANGGDYSNAYMAKISGDVTATNVAVNVSNGAFICISGNVTSTEDDVSAVYAVGGSVAIDGNVTSSGVNGTAISASKWDLLDTPKGAFVTVDGKITAYTPLRIEALPVGENEHNGETAEFGHYIYTDGINTVWIKPNSHISTNPNAQAPSIIAHPQDETVELGGAVTLTVSSKVSDGGTLSYQWYSNTIDHFSNGTLIEGATNTSYTPPTDTLGTRYYYVIVTNANETVAGEKYAQVISRLSAVTATYMDPFNKNGGDTEAEPSVNDYVTEALSGAVDFYFTNTALQRLRIHFDIRNTSNCCAFEKYGFTREGLIRQGKMGTSWCYYHNYCVPLDPHDASAALRQRLYAVHPQR